MARPVFTASIWWRCPPDISPVTFDHDDLFELPPFGEASSLFSYPVTAMQDHCCYLAFSHGLPRTAAAVRGDRTLCSRSGRDPVSVRPQSSPCPSLSG